MPSDWTNRRGKMICYSLSPIGNGNKTLNVPLAVLDGTSVGHCDVICRYVLHGVYFAHGRSSSGPSRHGSFAAVAARAVGAVQLLLN